MIKPFPNLLKRKRDKFDISSKDTSKIKEEKVSKPLIVFGIIISISSIFLLLFTINNKFG